LQCAIGQQRNPVGADVGNSGEIDRIASREAGERGTERRRVTDLQRAAGRRPVGLRLRVRQEEILTAQRIGACALRRFSAMDSPSSTVAA